MASADGVSNDGVNVAVAAAEAMSQGVIVVVAVGCRVVVHSVGLERVGVVAVGSIDLVHGGTTQVLEKTVDNAVVLSGPITVVDDVHGGGCFKNRATIVINCQSVIVGRLLTKGSQSMSTRIILRESAACKAHCNCEAQQLFLHLN